MPRADCSSNTIRDSISRVAPSLRGPRFAPALRHARRPCALTRVLIPPVGEPNGTQRTEDAAGEPIAVTTMLDLDLSGLKERDAALRKIDVAVNSTDALPPVRGTSSTPAPPKPVPVVAAKPAPTDRPWAADGKPRHRKNAYEYFNEWDSYDVDKELEKLEPNPAIVEVSEEAADDGLPPGLTAADLQGLSAIEVPQRPSSPLKQPHTRTRRPDPHCPHPWLAPRRLRRESAAR